MFWTAALLSETAIALTSAESVPGVWQNALVATGVAGLGASLYLIHMYVVPIKRFIQVGRALFTAIQYLLLSLQTVAVTVEQTAA